MFLQLNKYLQYILCIYLTRAFKSVEQALIAPETLFHSNSYVIS